MSFVSSINLLFYSQVFTCCKVNSATTFNSCCYCRSCSIICYCTTISSCISFEAIVVTTSWNVQVGEIKNCFRASYSFTIAIVISQCNSLTSCVVFVYHISGASSFYYATFISISTTRCRCNVKFICFQRISSSLKISYVNRRKWSVSSCIIKLS